MATTATTTSAAVSDRPIGSTLTTTLASDAIGTTPNTVTTSPGHNNNHTVHTTGKQVRLASRAGAHTTVTAGQAEGHLQANLIVLPSRYAADFRRLCARNPVPCPLLAESASPGDFSRVKSRVPAVLDDASFVGPGGEGQRDFDVRTDLPAYNVYRRGQLVQSGVSSIKAHWDEEDHVAFLIGCSFSFESALCAAGLPPRHTLARPARNVPMYRTAQPLHPAGVFAGATSVVSMRPYPLGEVDRVRAITAAFGAAHGEPVAWGWDAVGRLGIGDIDAPDWGDAARSPRGGLFGQESWGGEEEVPVFWGCGVTPQEAVMKAGGEIEGVVMGHAPGHMLVLDAKDEDLGRHSA